MGSTYKADCYTSLSFKGKDKLRKLSPAKMHKDKEKISDALKMRCSFHITHLKGYNYHKHLNSIKGHWQKLGFISAEGLCLSIGLEEYNV